MEKYTRPTTPLWVCTDCFVLHCNGDMPEKFDPDHKPLSQVGDMELSAGMLLEEHAEDCPNRRDGCERGMQHECGCETDSFSHSSCDTCGSPLGGERHAMTGWLPESA